MGNHNFIDMIKVFIIVFLVFTLTIANSCGGNCPSGRCNNCYCGTSTSYVDISTWCSKYSWSQSCCNCIASHESGGNANALNINGDGSYDVGLWQINTVNWAQCNGGQPPCDPSANLNCAIKVYQWGGNNFSLWSTAAGCGC